MHGPDPMLVVRGVREMLMRVVAGMARAVGCLAGTVSSAIPITCPLVLTMGAPESPSTNDADRRIMVRVMFAVP